MAREDRLEQPSFAHAGGRSPRGVTAWLQRRSTRRKGQIVLTLICLALVAIAFVGPFYWLVITALKPKEELFVMPLVFWPSELQWRNFSAVWHAAPFNRYLMNTTRITMLNIVGRTLSAAVVGYGFAVIPFRGRNFWFVTMLATMMIPPQVTLIPLFIIFRYLGWLDTFLPLVVPAFFGVGSAFYIFLMRQFFLTIPLEMEEAARIDGAGTLRTLASIYLPLAKPALIAVSLFTFMQAWNDFMGPLIYLKRQQNWTLTLGLAALADPNYVDYGPRMAGAVLISLPPIVIFFLSQRYFTRGITMTGLKG